MRKTSLGFGRVGLCKAVYGLVAMTMLLGNGLSRAAEPGSQKRVMVTPVLFPRSDPGVTGPPTNQIRQAYKNIFDPFWRINSYGNFDVISKTYGYINMPWPKDPEPGATAGADFTGDGTFMSGAGEPFTEEFSMGGSWLIVDGFWTPGERFLDADGTGEYTYADPWTDVLVPISFAPGSTNNVWDSVGEHFVDLDGNEQFTPQLVFVEIYDRALDNDLSIPGNIPNDGLAGDPNLIETELAIRGIYMNELIPDAANGATIYGGDVWPEDGDYVDAMALRNFVGDFPTQDFDENGLAISPVNPPDGAFNYGPSVANVEYIDTGNTVEYQTVTAEWDGEDGAWTATIETVTVNVLRTVEPYTDVDNTGEWTDRDAFEDFLVRWDVNSGEWIVVTNQYIFDNYPPVMDGDDIYDVGEFGPPSAGGFGPYPGTVAGNGIPDNVEYLMLRSGDGGGVDVTGDGVIDVLMPESNGIYDGPEAFENRGNTKMMPVMPAPGDFVTNPEPSNWDPHGFYPGGWQQWWQQTFGSEAPPWPNTFVKAVPFNSEVIRPFDPTVLPLKGEGDGTVMPDATGAYYDGPREFRDLPSSIYHIGGDLRLGEPTSPQSGSIWGVDKGNNQPPLDYMPDLRIESAGPLAYNVHGEHGWDAGNQLTIELLTWRTAGRSLTDTAVSNLNRRGGWAGLDTADRWCRDGNLDGLVDQGEAPDAGFANYTTDGDPRTFGPEGGDNGRDTNYPYNYQRLYEDIVATLDHAEDFTLFSDSGDQVDYLAVIYPDGYGGTDFGGASGQKHSDSALFPYPANPLINGTTFVGGILTRDSTSLIRFGGQVRNMNDEGEAEAQGASDYAMGIMAHEAAHDWLGAPDLYDYDAWNGIIYNNPIGGNDLMAGGGLVHFVGPLKRLFGWIQPKNLKAELTPGVPQVVEMYPIETKANQYYRFSRGAESFWFWYENAQTTVPWPKVSGPGIHILHEDLTESGNAVPKQQRISDHFTWQMVQADGLNELQDNINAGDPGDPFPGTTNNRTFNKYTNPSSTWWDTTESGIEILDIQLPATANAPARVTFRWVYRDVADLSFINPPGGSSIGSFYNLRYRVWDNAGDTSIYFYRDTDSAGYNGTQLNFFPATKIAGDQEDLFSIFLPTIPGTRLYNFYALLVPNKPADGIGNLWWPSSNKGKGSISFPVAPTISTATVDPADNAALQDWTLTCTVPGGNGVAEFVLEGSVSGILGPLTAGAAYATGTGNFSGNFSVQLNATTDFAAGDIITFKTTGLTPYSRTLVVVDGATPVPGGPIPQPVVVDTDGDGICDVWEFDNFGNLTTADATSDTSGDGLPDYWEYRLGSDPNNPYSLDPEGLLTDAEWDSDGDGISNYDEIFIFGTSPLYADTDDDGVNDGDELAGMTPSNPLYSADPGLKTINGVVAANWAMELDATAYPLPRPIGDRERFDLESWTIECWVRLDEADATGALVGYYGTHVKQVGQPAEDFAFYELGIDNGKPYVKFQSGNTVNLANVRKATAGYAVTAGVWTHVAGVFNPEQNRLTVYINGAPAGQITAFGYALSGVLTDDRFKGLAAIGSDGGLLGVIDGVRIWRTVRKPADIVKGMNNLVRPDAADLVCYFRFDDGGKMAEDFANGMRMRGPDGMRDYALRGIARVPGNPAAPTIGQFDDLDNDGLPDYWEDLYFNVPLTHYRAVLDEDGEPTGEFDEQLIRVFGSDAAAFSAVYLGWGADFTPIVSIPNRRLWRAPDRAWAFVDVYFEDQPGYLEMRSEISGDVVLFINGVRYGDIADALDAANDGDENTIYDPRYDSTDVETRVLSLPFAATTVPGYADNAELAPYFHRGRNRIAVELRNNGGADNSFSLELTENGTRHVLQHGDDPDLVDRIPHVARWLVYSSLGTMTPAPLDWNELEWWHADYALDAIADIDGDGFTNQEEFEMGTNPLVPDDLNLPPQWPAGAGIEIFPQAVDGTVAQDALLEARILKPAIDPNPGDVVIYGYQWFLNGAPLVGKVEKYLDLAVLAPTPGDILRVDVTARDLYGAMAGTLSDEVDVANRWSPAMPTAVSFLPQNPKPGNQLSAILTSPDMIRIRWYRNHEFVAEQNAVSGQLVVLNVELTAGDVWYFKAYAYDNFGGRSPVYNSLTPGNIGSRLVGPRYQSPETGADNLSPSPPVVRINPDKPNDLDDLRATIVTSSVDPEGDHFAYIYQWYKVSEDGDLEPIEGANGNFLSSSATATDDVWVVGVYALDVFGNSSPQAFSNVVIVRDALQGGGGDASDGTGTNFEFAFSYEPNNSMAEAKRILPVQDVEFTVGDSGTDDDDDTTGGIGDGDSFSRREFDAAEAQDHAIYPAGDEDWLWFYVPGQVNQTEPVRILFETNDGQLYEDRDPTMTSQQDFFDTQLWIYNQHGQQVAYNSTTGFQYSPGSTKYARWEGYLPPGKYYARIKAVNRMARIEEYRVVYFIYPGTIQAPYMATSATLSPAQPRSQDDLEVDAQGGYAADGSQSFNYWYVWFRNGELVPFGNSSVQPWQPFNLEHLHAVGPGRLPAGFTQPNVLPSQYTAEGETWVCKVYTRDAKGFSLDGVMTNEVVVGTAVWSHEMRITKTYNAASEIGNVKQNVTIGWFPEATHGFDKGLDAKLPPADTIAPPTPGGGAAILWDELTGASYSAGLESDALRLIRDWRPFGHGTAWYLVVEFGENPESVVIEWNQPEENGIGELPLMISEINGWGGVDEYSYRLTLDMRVNNRIVVPADELISGGRKVYRISLGASEDGHNLDLAYGWNLISFAVTPVMPAVANVFTVSGRSVIAGPVWTFTNNAYTKATEIVANQGYWVYCDIPGGTTIRSIGVRGRDMVPLEIGWNTVGPTETVEAPDTTVTIYGYNNANDTYFDIGSAGAGLPSWHVPGKLVKGAGYWIESGAKTAIRGQ